MMSENVAKFILQFSGIKLKEIPFNKETITIGRRGDNDILIDSLAVSDYHARVFKHGDTYSIEDVPGSKGTFVNDKRVEKCVLNGGDHIVIGKHTLVFKSGNEVKVKSEVHTINEGNPEFFAKNVERLMEQEKEEKGLRGVLSYIGNNGEIREVKLTQDVTVIGKGETVDIKVEGLFVGKSALLIYKKPDAFYISRGDGASSPKLNGEKIKGHIRLRDNDFIELGSVKMQFLTREIH